MYPLFQTEDFQHKPLVPFYTSPETAYRISVYEGICPAFHMSLPNRQISSDPASHELHAKKPRPPQFPDRNFRIHAPSNNKPSLPAPYPNHSDNMPQQNG